ncbi:glycosyltransferase [Elizabethkingia anophelis]|nr:glycosyltransferase [Elizabethkingia anophelis]
MIMMPKVSVIIPNYNHSAFLVERIESVLNQSYGDFEVIILDDCSKDNSVEIIEKYRTHPKISHIVFNQINSGSTFQQWKKGIALAKGEWIWLAESDDVAESSFLETFNVFLTKYPEFVLFFCASHYIDEFGTRTNKVTWAEDISERNWQNDFYANGIVEIQEQFFYKNIIPNASAVIFKKEAVDKEVFEIISNMKFSGDWFFWIKLLESGNMAYTSKVLNYFRNHRFTTRALKSGKEEKKRYAEYFTVIRYIRDKYKLNWDVRKHDWILKEWCVRYKKINKSKYLLYNPYFPFLYNWSFLKMMIREKIK